MTDQPPIIVWFRNDLRLADNPALTQAAASGRPVIPVFILDATASLRAPGAASLWWLDKSLRAFADSLDRLDSRLILRRGAAGAALKALVAETGAAAVHWSRAYAPDEVARDTALKADLKRSGVAVESFNAALLVEPWQVKNGAGEPFKVFTPFWRAAQAAMDAVEPLPAPARLAAPAVWPSRDAIDDWGLHPSKPDWSAGFSDWTPGEAGAAARLDTFLNGRLVHYAEGRDRPGFDVTSRLSPHLRFGEIGPRQVFRAAQTASALDPMLERTTGKFLSELGWREFSHNLLFHGGDIARANIRPAFDSFPWRDDPVGLAAWRRGATGYPLVDAGMRELWATGYMHNRVRMVVASFLIKHLLIDWRQGEAWFWDTLVDADPANNPASWQWVAGSGADAQPFFRIFNPMEQGRKFDPDGRYVRRWVPELAKLPDDALHEPWSVRPEVLNAAGVVLGRTYPHPIVDHRLARERALAAFKSINSQG